MGRLDKIGKALAAGFAEGIARHQEKWHMQAAWRNFRVVVRFGAMAPDEATLREAVETLKAQASLVLPGLNILLKNAAATAVLSVEVENAEASEAPKAEK